MAWIEMFLAIEDSDHFGSGILFYKAIDTSFCPRKNDRIVLYPYEREDMGDGPLGVVKEVYWTATGQVRLDFEHYIIDPSEQMENHIRLSINCSSALHGWYTNRDGDLIASLNSGGWREYNARDNRTS